MPEDVAWPWRGCVEHSDEAASSESVNVVIGQIDFGMQLIATALEQSARSVNAARLSNELSALACYTRAFRALRAATILAMGGLYLEARVYIRDVYESAGLGRVLALNPTKADDWLIRDRWIKDNEVRQYVEKFVVPVEGLESSPYREYYRQASELHHPTVHGCLPLVLDGIDAECSPKLESYYDADTLHAVLREIAIECTFVCFTIITAAANPEVVWPEWRKAVVDLAKELYGEEDFSHLERDWAADQERFSAIASQVLTSDEIDRVLDHEPNSARNVLRRFHEAEQRDNE